MCPIFYCVFTWFIIVQGLNLLLTTGYFDVFLDWNTPSKMQSQNTYTRESADNHGRLCMHNFRGTHLCLRLISLFVSLFTNPGVRFFCCSLFKIISICTTKFHVHFYFQIVLLITILTLSF